MSYWYIPTPKGEFYLQYTGRYSVIAMTLSKAYDDLSKAEKAKMNLVLREIISPSDVYSDSQGSRFECSLVSQADCLETELHLLAGALINKNLPEYLENHYTRYFKDRMAVVNFSRQRLGLD